MYLGDIAINDTVLYNGFELRSNEMANTVLREMYQQLDALSTGVRKLSESQQIENKQKIAASLVAQIKAFVETPNGQPYCVLKDVVRPYYDITNSVADIAEFLSTINHKFHVLLLGERSEVTSSTQSMVVRVHKVAVLLKATTQCQYHAMDKWTSEYKGTQKATVLDVSAINDKSYKLQFDELQPQSKL